MKSCVLATTFLAVSRLLSARVNATMPAEVVHLPSRDVVARVLGKAPASALWRRPGGRRGAWPLGRPFSQWRCMRRCRVFKPRNTRKQSIGPGTAPQRVLQGPELVGPIFVRRHKATHHHVRVASEVFGHAVHHHICPEVKRVLEHGRGERGCPPPRGPPFLSRLGPPPRCP